MVSLDEPLHLVTSGYEQESLLAIWENLNGRSVYVSRWDEPFRWAIYNWLFYESYTAFTGLFLEMFSLTDSWLPTIARNMTLLGVGVVTVQCYIVLREVRTKNGPEALHSAALAVFVGVGPLVGYWGMTTRPDIWALALEIATVLVYLKFRLSRPLCAVLFCCIFAYAAWAFKQSNLSAIVAIGAFLLIRLRWKELFLLVGTMVAAFSATLAFGSDYFRASILLLEWKGTNSVENSLRILLATAPKTFPFIFGLFTLFVLLLSKPNLLRNVALNDYALIAIFGVVVSGVFAFLTSIQPGAAENYYFVTTFFSAVLICIIMSQSSRLISGSEHVFRASISFGWILQGLAIGAVLFGFIGTTSLRHFDTYYRSMGACLAQLPRPLFVDNHYLSLPWMNPNNVSYVLAFGYGKEIPTEENKYFGDGIGGKIKRQEFAALAFTNSPGGTYDGAPLSHYRPVDSSCEDLYVFLRP